MYERFTDRARKVIQLANQEADRFNHEFVGTEHVLLGLVKEGGGVAANVLKGFGAELRTLRMAVGKITPSGPDREIFGKLPLTPRARKAIDRAFEEAQSLEHHYVGTEHLLLGLVRDEQGTAALVLANLGIQPLDVRREVLNILGHDLE